MHSIGTVLKGRYEITRLISPGAMSTAIYVAKDLSGSNGPVLIKEVDSANLDASKKSDLETAIMNEAMRLHEANTPASHPNIVKFYEFFREGLIKYLVMGFVEGESLKEKLIRVGAVPESQAVDYILQTLSAWKYLHSKTPPVVHQDLKPENCIITPNNKLVIVDFGASKQVIDAEHLTHNLGTFGYAALEQCEGYVDPRADIRAAGSVLYEMLSGEQPDSKFMVFKQQVNKLYQSTITKTLVDIIVRATKIDPDDRYKTAGEMSDALQSINNNHTACSKASNSQTASSVSATKTSHLSPAGGASRTPISTGVAAGWLGFKDIVCIGADGNAFEEHKQIYVARDVIRKSDRSVDTSFTPYKGITHFEKRGNDEFLPSFALTCNILVALYVEMRKGNKDAQVILDQYKNRGDGFGWYAQNTIVQWNGGNSIVIHYPYDDQFPKYGGRDNVNPQGFHKELGFNSNGFGDMLLKDALRKNEFNKYIKNLTGLPNPSILIELGKYFGKPAKIWVPNKPDNFKDTCAAWLGCGNSNFDIYTYDDLNNNYGGARGVRR